MKDRGSSGKHVGCGFEQNCKMAGKKILQLLVRSVHRNRTLPINKSSQAHEHIRHIHKPALYSALLGRWGPRRNTRDAPLPHGGKCQTRTWRIFIAVCNSQQQYKWQRVEMFATWPHQLLCEPLPNTPGTGHVHWKHHSLSSFRGYCHTLLTHKQIKGKINIQKLKTNHMLHLFPKHNNYSQHYMRALNNLTEYQLKYMHKE